MTPFFWSIRQVLARGRLRLGLLCAMCVLSMASPARAAVVYQGEWDPGFGSAFPSMGWRATALLILDDNCASAFAAFTGTATSGDLAAVTACGQTLNPLGGARIESLQVGFYAFPGTGPSTDRYEGADFTVKPSGSCGTSFFSFGSRDCLSWLQFDAGEVVGLQTSFSSWLTLQPGSIGYPSSLTGTMCAGHEPLSNNTSRVDFSVQLGIGSGAVSNMAASIDQMDCGLPFSENQPDVMTLTRLPNTPVPEPAQALCWALGLAALGQRGAALRWASRRQS
jgi:hypothetical protein